MCWAAPLPPLYIRGEGGLCPHLGFPPLRWRQPPSPFGLAAKWGGDGGAPGMGLRAHLPLGFAPLLPRRMGLGGEAPQPT